MPRLNNATIGKLAPILPLLHPGYTVWAPYHANSYPITGGPQFNYRHFKYVTLFIHSDIGATYQTVTVHPQDQIMTGIVTSLLGRSMKTSQWTPFYGVGGGFDLSVSKHVGLRFQSDWVSTQLFENLLRNPQYTWCMSASPTFRFGKNLPK